MQRLEKMLKINKHTCSFIRNTRVIKKYSQFFEKLHLVWHFRSFLDWCQILLELQWKSAEYHFERHQCTNSQMRKKYLKKVNNWIKMDRNVSNCIKLDDIGLKETKRDPKESYRLDLTVSSWIKRDKMG